MIYSIQYLDNEFPAPGRVALIGDKNKILGEYRMLSRIIFDQYGVDTVLATLDLAHDDISRVAIDIKEGGKT